MKTSKFEENSSKPTPEPQSCEFDRSRKISTIGELAARIKKDLEGSGFTERKDPPARTENKDIHQYEVRFVQKSVNIAKPHDPRAAATDLTQEPEVQAPFVEKSSFKRVFGRISKYVSAQFVI